ncbi:serine protease persephone [Amyelois transitella]|uniref:serine protease persephone n=1 Tax=Amyelois transitella TaxID=680683 RepID=UPI00298F8775|nr:serine protease persephone [Amyelois transitella]
MCITINVIIIICFVNINGISLRDIARTKRQILEVEENWVWGYYENNTPISKENKAKIISTSTEASFLKATKAPLEQLRQDTTITTQINSTPTSTSSPETTTRNFCDPIPKPDFKGPGLRVNEEKCMGYIWELQNRIKMQQQDEICNPRKLWNINHAIGGRLTETGEFPHMGALGWKAVVGTWIFKCGSSLISHNFVLTAAHCAKASSRDSSLADPIPKIVRLGDKIIVDVKNHFRFPTDANISRIIVHPQYVSPVKYYDIALMQLEKPVQFTRLIQPACLWNSFYTGDAGHLATLTGWGVVKSGSLDISPELQAATVNVLDTAQCDELLKNSQNRNWRGFQEHQLCAGKLEGGVDSCQGDSGGPLQMKIPIPKELTDKQGSMHYIIGVISFGVGCAHPNLPGIYTRVSSFVDWIEGIVWKNETNVDTIKTELNLSRNYIPPLI